MENNMTIHKLMHARDISPAQLKSLNYPVYVSPKLDGIHFYHHNKKMNSRAFKALPNLELQTRFGNENILKNIEGEITIGNPVAEDVFKKTHSFVMSRHIKEDMIDKVGLYIFDITDKDNLTFHDRYKLLQSMADKFPEGVYLLEQTLVYSLEELLNFEKDALNKGAEGIMIRNPLSLYKFGDSTLAEKEIVKLKRFKDSEAIIIDIYPMIGHPEKAGGVLVRDIKTKVEFGLGTGFTDEERKDIWRRHKAMIGKIVKYKYMKTSGYSKPRFPSFLGFRDPIDIIDFPKEEMSALLNL